VQDVPVAAGGVFLAALERYPEDAGVALTLRFADGHAEHHPFGTSPFVVPDPGELGAWTTQVWSFGSSPGQRPDNRVCVSFSPAREVHAPPVSPQACGEQENTRHPRGWFFTAQRVERGSGDAVAFDRDGHWGGHPSRTAVWGLANDDVRRVELLGPGSRRRVLTRAPSRAFLAVFDPKVDPASLRVRVTFTDGRVETRAGSAHLVKGPRG
jgi:hypothetical protein